LPAAPELPPFPRSAEELVPVYRPLMPRAEAIRPYLEKLDLSRVYANRGELLVTLEQRLAALLGLPEPALVLAASGTAALTGAILATAGRAGDDRPICLCSGYTFVAAALAAELCGYRLRLADIDSATWALAPDRLTPGDLDGVGLVLAVAPYGRRFSQAAWSAFQRRTAIPVVIDAAAGFEAFAADPADLFGPVPTVLSLHATKPFSTGEGGAILCSDADVLRRAVALMNFGFDGTRLATGPGFNGKMSEYHAAVGLAELDGWPQKRAAHLAVAHAYEQAAARRGLTLHVAPKLGGCYALFEAPSPAAAQRAAAALTGAGIGHRFWYGHGLHREPHFQGCDHGGLAVADDLAARLIGLPVAPGLAGSAIEHVCAVLAAAG
jgi:dTDP-4-amino-4,6-dideoxygalactose transaminase